MVRTDLGPYLLTSFVSGTLSICCVYIIVRSLQTFFNCLIYSTTFQCSSKSIRHPRNPSVILWCPFVIVSSCKDLTPPGSVRIFSVLYESSQCGSSFRGYSFGPSISTLSLFNICYFLFSLHSVSFAINSTSRYNKLLIFQTVISSLVVQSRVELINTFLEILYNFLNYLPFDFSFPDYSGLTSSFSFSSSSIPDTPVVFEVSNETHTTLR